MKFENKVITLVACLTETVYTFFPTRNYSSWTSERIIKCNHLLKEKNHLKLLQKKKKEQKNTNLHLLIAALMDDKGPWLGKKKKRRHKLHNHYSF